MIADEIRISQEANEVDLLESVRWKLADDELGLSDEEADALRLVLQKQAPGAPEHPKLYNVVNDCFDLATQEEVDRLVASLYKMMPLAYPNRQMPLDIAPGALPGRLKVFANPMSEYGVFVAEDKPLLPNGDRWQGRPVYPAMPKDAWAFPTMLPRTIAEEIVRRWNAALPDPGFI